MSAARTTPSRLPVIPVIPVTTALAVLVALLSTLVVATGPAANAAEQRNGVTVFKVPTANAGLGRIVTGSDGTIFFVERNARKVAMIGADGVVREILFPAANPADAAIVDLDVAPDGRVWVVYDSGRLMLALDAAGAVVRPVGGGYGFANYVAGAVRVAPDGVVWNQVRSATDGSLSLSRTYDAGPLSPDVTPACGPVLGVGSDGAMWCGSGSSVVRLDNPPSTSGSIAGLPFATGTTPRALAAGPGASIWFAGYAADSPTAGRVGYVDRATGFVRSFTTGAATAPADLVRGPDGAMWFTSVGARTGIGRITPDGVGAVTAIGAHDPSYLTFGRDGALWFTDTARNEIVRVTPARVQAATARLVSVVGKHRARASRGLVPVTIACSADALGACTGTFRLSSASKVRRLGAAKYVALSRRLSFSVPPGSAQLVTITLNGAGKRAVRHSVTARAEIDGTSIARLRITKK